MANTHSHKKGKERTTRRQMEEGEDSARERERERWGSRRLSEWRMEKADVDLNATIK